MVDRTLYRPREIIQFCVGAIDETREQRTPLPVDYSVLTAAELTYSEDRAKDISAEYRFQYPGLLSIFEVFRGRNYSLDWDELSLLCLEIATGSSPTADTESWVVDQDPDAMIEILWRIGFLRAQAVGGIKARRRSGSSYLGPHQVC
jgi:hypothetical protein